MKRIGWGKLLAAAGVWSIVFGAGSVSARTQHAEPPVRVAVSIFNDALVEQTVLRGAQSRAEEVMKAGGIELVWLDCGTPGHWAAQEMRCSDIAFPAHLSARLVANTSPSSRDAFGESFTNGKGEGSYANVYVAPLAQAKVLGVLTEGELIGYVIAHELGHLLMGNDSHGEIGLMRSVWRAPEVELALRGTLFFTEAEKDKMRRRVLSAAAHRNAVTDLRIAAGR